MRFLESGRKLLTEFEGLALVAYRDPAGIWTIGRGHTKGAFEGMTCSQEQADRWFLEDIQEFCDAVVRELSPMAIIKMTDEKFTALVCFAYNVKGWRTSNQMARIRSADWKGAEAHWLKYDHVEVDGEMKEVEGLRRRREAELAIFQSA